MNKSLYVLIIIDEGIIQKVVSSDSDSSIQAIASIQIKRYLDSAGLLWDKSVELATDDGYAKISKTILNDPDSEEHIWSYSFDGEETLIDAIKRIPLDSVIQFASDPCSI